MRDRYDVAIVGYGPVGQTLAILLGQRGWKVGVFEKQSTAYPLPRAVHFDHEVGRILQAAGIADGLVAMTEAADVYEWRNAAGETLLRFESRTAGVSGWPEANMLAQPELERLLDARARSLPTVEVHRGHEVIGIGATDRTVQLDVATIEGRRLATQAGWVVGCDGANSFVRPHLGATVTDLGFFFDWLIVDILPHEPKVRSPLNIQICDPARPTTLVSGGPGRRRWEFMRLPGESLEELNRAETAWRLLASWGVTPGNATLERHTVYRFQARWVDTWRKGRLLLAGDAAHQMPPFAGQGMCSGLRDAANLAWKMDLVLAERAPGALLDTYARERIPHVRAIVDFSMELGRVICIADPAEAAARDAVMLAAIKEGQQTTPPPAPGIGPGVLLTGDPLAGQLFVQGRVRAGGVTGLFDDVVGHGWTLLSPLADPAQGLEAGAAAFFTQLGGVSAQVGRNAPVEDLDGTYGRWFERTGVAVVLQRPDFHVFGTAASLAGATALIESLRRALACEDRPVDRSRARALAREAIARGDALAWFETLYREAEAGTTVVPWADLVPNPHLVAWLEAHPGLGGRALDVGTGFGDNAEELARRGFAVVAFDVAGTAVARARERFPGSPVRYAVADLLEPPAEWRGAFDLVAETYTLQVLPAPERALAVQALRTFVAPGGTLLVIARGREPAEPEGAMPWPLTRREVEAIAGDGLTLTGLEDFLDDEDPPVRRLRATFRRR
jgi:flavoprotein hydroxylase